MPICGYKNEDGTPCKVGGSSDFVHQHELTVHKKRPSTKGRPADPNVQMVIRHHNERQIIDYKYDQIDGRNRSSRQKGRSRK